MLLENVRFHVTLVVALIIGYHANKIYFDMEDNHIEEVMEVMEVMEDNHIEEVIKKITIISSNGTKQEWKKNSFDEKNIKAITFKTKFNEYKINLWINRNLFHPEYSITYQRQSTANVYKVSTSDTDYNCHYRGHVENKNSDVVLSLCDGGISGVLRTIDGEIYHVENKNNESFVMLKYFPRYKTSGIKNEQYQTVKHKSSSKFRRNTNPYIYMNTAIIVDKAFYIKYGADVENYIIAIASQVDFLYRTVGFRLALVFVEIWNEVDLINLGNNTRENLRLFDEYNYEELIIILKKSHDVALLLTGKPEEGSLAGLAGSGTMCSRSCTGIAMDVGLLKATAHIVAHEIGHTLGLPHDYVSCTCPSPPCVMSPVIDVGKVSNGFSICSKETLTNRINTGNYHCLSDIPKKLYSLPVCGNAFLEEGEECDCGSPEDCDDECCDAIKCRLKDGAACSKGECCHKCQFLESGIICRSRKNECDLEEYCTGTSKLCPQNTYKQNFLRCRSGQGFCIFGKCSPTYNDQCKWMWGTNAKDGHDVCYDSLNVKGDFFGNCGTNLDGSYNQCAQMDARCGTLKCTGENIPTFPVIGQVLKAGKKTFTFSGTLKTCSVASVFLGYDVPDPTLVQIGTVCAEGKICYNAKCSNVSSIKEIEQSCAQKCFNGGICNNFGNCHCPLGYSCPTCKEPGTGGSIDGGGQCYRQEMKISSPTAASVSHIVSGLIALVVVLIIAFMVVKKKNKFRRCFAKRWHRGSESSNTAIVNDVIEITIQNNTNNNGGDNNIEKSMKEKDDNNNILVSSDASNNILPEDISTNPIGVESNECIEVTGRRNQRKSLQRILPPVRNLPPHELLDRRGSLPILVATEYELNRKKQKTYSRSQSHGILNDLPLAQKKSVLVTLPHISTTRRSSLMATDKNPNFRILARQLDVALNKETKKREHPKRTIKKKRNKTSPLVRNTTVTVVNKTTTIHTDSHVKSGEEIFYNTPKNTSAIKTDVTLKKKAKTKSTRSVRPLKLESPKVIGRSKQT